MSKYIGVLDSGVGGLSVLKELKTQMPNSSFIYFGDTKNMPYGTKTPDEIYLYTKNILNFFQKKDVQNVVFACNTTSAVAYDRLKVEFQNKLNIFPLIQTVAKDAIKGLENNDTIAILATRATINSNKYATEIKKYNPKINVVGIDCTGFVEIVENRTYGEEKSIALIKEKLDIVRENKAKRIVLGCTHYPYLVDIFKSIMNDVEYFNPACSLSEIVKKQTYEASSKNGIVEYYVSKNPEEFRKSAKAFFDIKEVINLV